MTLDRRVTAKELASWLRERAAFQRKWESDATDLRTWLGEAAEQPRPHEQLDRAADELDRLAGEVEMLRGALQIHACTCPGACERPPEDQDMCCRAHNALEGIPPGAG